ncbi:hypothetical protein U9M48_039524 [Paspalum notatum var. saurae]|uniref:Uncharacterized protein n=1 Tax=Paspalum notatum var. saurae TaxID=547442 RepID=A0AAQ3UJT4_PASNO
MGSRGPSLDPHRTGRHCGCSPSPLLPTSDAHIASTSISCSPPATLTPLGRQGPSAPLDSIPCLGNQRLVSKEWLITAVCKCTN